MDESENVTIGSSGGLAVFAVLVGVAAFGAGLSMEDTRTATVEVCAETGDVSADGETCPSGLHYTEQRTVDNEYRTPLMVVGGSLAAVGFAYLS